MPRNRFEVDIQRIRRDARAHMHADVGPVSLVSVLNDVVAGEIVCALQHRDYAAAATLFGRGEVADECGEHAVNERKQVAWLAERVGQLGGIPDLNPPLDRVTSTALNEAHLDGMLRDSLVAEQRVLRIYAEAISWIGATDTVSRRLIELIESAERRHTSLLGGLLIRS